MDADVVAAVGLDTLTDVISSSDHDGFLYPESRLGTSNAVLFSSQHPAKSAKLLDVLIGNTEYLDVLSSQTTWITKRSLQHDEATVRTTGPGATRALGLSENKANNIPEDIFYHRQPLPAQTQANTIEREQSISDVIFKWVRRGLDGRG
ncbi:hypothetical protein [Pseudomonas moorei]|uniref:hypothetical protein n=1 Tax=Pseudomonas moorei TaxID=395599 RepID=UPI00200E9AD4|nr:hypothetical protein [Pseudomonas moorei]